MVDLLPELLSVYDTGTAKPHVKFFEGKDAYQTVAEDALTIQEEPKELLTFINTDTFYSIMDDEYEYEYFIPERIRRKTFAKGLVKETKQSKEQVKNNKQLFRETKFLPTNFDLDLTAYIYENKVALFTSEKELSVLLIESKETYTFFKSLFYTIWNSSIE